MANCLRIDVTIVETFIGCTYYAFEGKSTEKPQIGRTLDELYDEKKDQIIRKDYMFHSWLMAWLLTSLPLHFYILRNNNCHLRDLRQVFNNLCC